MTVRLTIDLDDDDARAAQATLALGGADFRIKAHETLVPSDKLIYLAYAALSEAVIPPQLAAVGATGPLVPGSPVNKNTPIGTKVRWAETYTHERRGVQTTRGPRLNGGWNVEPWGGWVTDHLLVVAGPEDEK